MDDAHDEARQTRAAAMPIPSAGLFYCSQPRSKCFTTPFVVESAPQDRQVSDIWNGTWFLPFKIRAIGDPSITVSWARACKSWPFLRDHENRGSLVTPARAFAPVWIPRDEWDLVLDELGVEPDSFEQSLKA